VIPARRIKWASLALGDKERAHESLTLKETEGHTQSGGRARVCIRDLASDPTLGPGKGLGWATWLLCQWTSRSVK
jgi:hypothetical protein